MHDDTRRFLPRLFRAAALALTPLLALTLVAFPALHSMNCSGVCDATALPERTAPSEGSSCHGGDRAASTGSAGGGCHCIDDCCSLNALFNTPAAVGDGGPTVEVVAPLGARAPEPRPNPGAWILPYPTGPPSIV